MRTTLIRLQAGAAALAAALTLLTGLAGVAGAAMRPTAVMSPKLGKYTLVTANFSVPADSANGGYITCPTGQRAVTGGVFLSNSACPIETRTEAWIGDSTITTDGKGWYGTGVNYTNSPLTVWVSVHCLPARQLRGAVTITQQFTGAHTEGGYVVLPVRMRTLSGGGFFALPGQGPNPTNLWHRLGSSTATTDGLGWYADGAWFGIGEPAQTLTVVLRCLPAAALSGWTLVTQDLTVPGGEGASGTYLSCPAGTLAYTGGAFWHQPGQGPNPDLALSTWTLGNTATFPHAVGWFASGTNASPAGNNLLLTLDAQCLPTG